jgi:choline dehydrogenase-like flavoprotein
MNAWEKLGNPGWGWDDFSPYVRKFHTAAPPSSDIRDLFKGMKHEQQDQGTTGPVQVSLGDQYMPYHPAWMETFKTLGYPQDEDPINGKCTGPFLPPSAIDPVTHTRSHSAAAYLGSEIQARSNLRVVTGALVEKIIMEKQERDADAVATGVQFTKDSNTHTVSVAKEVILAAGAIQSPQILELSGIGDKHLLQSHGIPTLIDSPGVGENLQDHGYVPFGYEVADGLPSGDMARDPAVAAAAMAAYQKDGSGPLSMAPFIAAFMPLVDTPENKQNKVLQKLQESLDNPSLSRAHKRQYEVLQTMLQNPNEPNAQYLLAPFQILPREKETKAIFSFGHPGFFITFVSLLSYPLSRGSVHIQSSDPKAAPLIDSGLLRHPADLELHARHNMYMEKIAETEPLASLLKKGGERLHSPEPLTDLEKAQDLCKELMLSMYHLSGTCAMMPREDGGVVDSRLRVYGAPNVRVVDASIFPLVPRGNIQATVFAVAEKAADIIKQDLD